ncbi:MAG: phosphatidate cytidylyltransferase [Treponema sp.]|uniref:diacylglycerol/polyprenol kinase family protein n=1 Tax=Treponema sp. TaxID=166 RepID=UPI001B546790|nr:phosphatidate cytidylyltransferase [Treponema sp.]MBP5402426.1 phosphatidate cytidylyltransferase [Treponema sp.]MBR5932351.1 phosphatidate cytidylyltransferase [Treponema sp.]
MKLLCPYNGILVRRYVNSLYKELFRKSIHLCTVFIPALLHRFYWVIEVLLILAALGFTLSEILRLNGIEVPVVSDITKVAARKRDEGKFVLGPLTLVAGIVISSLIFPERSYTIGILSLATGDGLASLCGKFFGRINIPFTEGKTVAGSLSCFAAVFCCSFIISRDVYASLIIALVGMIIEVFPLKDFDNVLIPVGLSYVATFLV